MIRKLRGHFIRAAMLSVLLVIGSIIAMINIMNYHIVGVNADSILSILENRIQTGTLEKEPPAMHDHGEMRPGTPPEEQPFTQENQGFFRKVFFRETISRETLYESRYFYMILSEDGTILRSDTSNVASIGEEDLNSFVAAVSGKATPSIGFYDNYRFLKTELEEGTLLLFLDCDRSLTYFRVSLEFSLLIMTTALIGVFLMIWLSSGTVIRPVQESYEKQRRFITDAGHELKTPLTIIDADITVAEMEVGENEWLDDVKLQTKRLADLTNDLIYLSRMDEGAEPLRTSEFPLSDLVSDTAQSFRSRIQLEEKSLETDIDPSITMTGDEKALEKLLVILLDNAVKYTRDHGQIRLALKKKARTVSLSVENETDQITSDMLKHIFERFYRADASRNSSRGGYGIGLSIAQAIVHAHGGTIEASAPAKDWLRISATLPLS